MKLRLGVLTLALAVPAGLADDKIAWAKDWDSAKKTAADSKKLVMIDFWREK